MWDKEKLKEDIIKWVKKDLQVSIAEIARAYEDCKYIPRRETRSAVRELIEEGILCRVDDTDFAGRKSDCVVLLNEAE